MENCQLFLGIHPWAGGYEIMASSYQLRVWDGGSVLWLLRNVFDKKNKNKST